MTSHEATLYHSDPERPEWVICDLCHHRCRIAPGERGVCHARRNTDGRLDTLVYGRAVALNPDPIEKKPLFHFLPGTQSMSVATVGCNFHCEFCQNHHISQQLTNAEEVPGKWAPPEKIVAAAQRAGCHSIAFTYTEPTVFFEYALDTARIARQNDIATCFVSNGYMTPEAVDRIAPYLNAINVDLKAFNQETYRRVIGGRLEGVLETIRHLHERGIWIEATTLVVTDMNDSPEELRNIAGFLAGVSVDIPWHVSRFHPQYHMTDRGPTPVDRIMRAIEIGREEGLRHIYCGNCRDERYQSTWCHHCGERLVERAGYTIMENLLGADGHCPSCDTPCAGIWVRNG